MNSMKGALINRRQLVHGIAAGVISPSSIASALGSAAELATIAATKGITFGSQIASDFFSPSYLNLYRGAVHIVTPENDLKATRLQSRPAGYNFSGGDRIVDFASTNNAAVHGHTLIWGNGKYNPPWIRQLPHEKVANFIDEYIATVVGHYRGRIVSWDDNQLGHGKRPAISGRSVL